MTASRGQGIARQMRQILLENLKGQQVYLFTEENSNFYRKLGFTEQPMGMGQVIGRWLVEE
ncbi:MAG: hypothetical protein AB4368_25080 [Xenococcaceae cyanobacterium]